MKVHLFILIDLMITLSAFVFSAVITVVTTPSLSLCPVAGHFKWSQIGNPLIGTGYTGAQFQGSSVSLSADGTVLAIGGFKANNGTGATCKSFPIL